VVVDMLTSTLRNLASQLIKHEGVTTTLPRALELRKMADKLVTAAKQGSLRARRKVRATLQTHDAEQKLFSELAHRYLEQSGGYTRVTRIKSRGGDNAVLGRVEFVTIIP